MTRPRWYPPARVLVCIAVLGLALLGSSASGEASGANVPPYSASASAIGAHLTVTIPGFPVTETPVSSGGPTAQARRDSSGTNQGYAAFPDPGESLVSVPSLISGLLAAGGAGGLPPIDVPTLPSYPLYVSSDPSIEPDASAGTGPYQLRATSEASTTTATAAGGLQTAAAGNIALVTSKTSITELPDGTVVCTAVTDAQGISIGPLTIGQVISTATMTLTGSTVTRHTQIEVSGLRIAGLPVASFTADGLSFARTTVPVPIPDLLAQLLAPANLAPTVLAPQQFPDRVIAPAFQITAPVNVPSFGVGHYTLTIGSATASLVAASPAKGASTSTTPLLPAEARTGGPSGAVDRFTTTMGDATGAAPSAPTSTEGAPLAVGPLQLSAESLADITHLYLIVAALACMAAILGQAIRWGVRA